MLLGSHISRYLVLGVLGEGGMGSVYLVEHIDLKTRHAIKVLLPHLSKHPQIVQRFRNEARAAAATRSPNIVAVRDFAQLDDGSWYLVMDYWEGMTLSAFMASRGPLPHEVVVRTAIDALNGLAAAHRRRIIHRDLKPDNLYLAEVDGDVRAMILDFGVCRLGEETGVVTRTGALIGTPRYMAPEQLRGKAIDHTVDLWSIGAIAYEMATGGWLPYDDENAPKRQILDEAALNARMASAPVDPKRRAPAISRALADAILTMIDPDPARRPASAAQCALLLADTLPGDRHEEGGRALLQRRAPELLRQRSSPPSAMARPVVVPQSTTLGGIASQSCSSPVSSSAKLRRWVMVVLGVAVACAAFAVSYVALRSSPAPAEGASIAVAPTAPAPVEPASVPVVSAAPAPLDTAPPLPTPPAPVPIDAGVPDPMPATANANPIAAKAPLDAGTPSRTPAARPQVETGALSIYVVPFAQVWVDDSEISVGQTPLHLKLRIGKHRIRLANKRLGKDVIVPVTVTAAKEAVIDESW